MTDRDLRTELRALGLLHVHEHLAFALAQRELDALGDTRPVLGAHRDSVSDERDVVP